MKDSGLLKLKTVGIYASMKVTTKKDEADPDFQFPTCCIGVEFSHKTTQVTNNFGTPFGKWKHCCLMYICVNSSMTNSSCKGDEQLKTDVEQYAR